MLRAALALWVPLAAGGTAKLVASLVLAPASLRFPAAGAYELSAAEPWAHAAGVIGPIPPSALRNAPESWGRSWWPCASGPVGTCPPAASGASRPEHRHAT
ncbi:hypothetical protein SUDANB6_01117 [Streptomyces sp. enrichment culture]